MARHSFESSIQLPEHASGMVKHCHNLEVGPVTLVALVGEVIQAPFGHIQPFINTAGAHQPKAKFPPEMKSACQISPCEERRKHLYFVETIFWC